MDWKTIYSTFDLKVRQGKFKEVTHELKKLSFINLPRSEANLYADLSRRCGLFFLGLKILTPYVRSQFIDIKPTESELITYSALLIKIGSFDEAISRLQKIPANNVFALQFLAFAYQSQWNFKKAIPLFEEIELSKELSSYQQCVIKVNLASAYLEVNYLKKAKIKLNELINLTRLNKWDLLQLNVLELVTQLYIEQKNYEVAESYIYQTEVLLHMLKLGNENNRYFLLINKNFALLKLKSSDIDLKNNGLKLMTQIRNNAESGNYWELVRECDFHIARFTKDLNLANHLYYGSASSHFIKKITDYFPKSTLLKKYCLEFNAEANVENNLLNLVDGYWNLKSDSLDLNSVPLLLLIILVNDFYRPQSLGAIFSSLYPGEFFNPQTSPKRVFQALHRLRGILKEKKIPLYFDCKNNLISIYK